MDMPIGVGSALEDGGVNTDDSQIASPHREVSWTVAGVQKNSQEQV